MKMNTKTTLIVWFATAAITSAHASYAFTNFAGQPGGSGNANGTGIAARFNYPIGVATDASGNFMSRTPKTIPSAGLRWRGAW